MRNLYLPKDVQRIVLLHPDGPMTVHEDRKKKRKRSRALKPMRKLMRTMAKSNLAHAEEFLARSDRSDRKKKNGMVRDIGRNSWRANRKGSKVWRKAYM